MLRLHHEGILSIPSHPWFFPDDSGELVDRLPPPHGFLRWNKDTPRPFGPFWPGRDYVLHIGSLCIDGPHRGRTNKTFPARDDRRDVAGGYNTGHSACERC